MATSPTHAVHLHLHLHLQHEQDLFPNPTAQDLARPAMTGTVGRTDRVLGGNKPTMLTGRPRCGEDGSIPCRQHRHHIKKIPRCHDTIWTVVGLISQWLSVRLGCHTEPFRSLVDHPGQETHQLGTGPERVVCKRSMPHACGLCTPQRCTHHNPQLPKRYGGISSFAYGIRLCFFNGPPPFSYSFLGTM